jgi:transposase
MAELFGVHLVTATIARISQDCAELSQGFAADTIRDRVAAAPVKHVDETGFRIGGKTQRLHDASAIWLTFHRVSPKRASLLAHATGIAVHDHWKPLRRSERCAACAVQCHHLRELKALVKIEREDWARKMQRLRRRACHATNLAREQGVAVRPGLIMLIERCYDAILADGLAFHQAQPALIRAGAQSSRQAAAADRSAVAPECPQTGCNALSHRSARALHQQPRGTRRSGDESAAEDLRGFRSDDGARDFAVVRSVLPAARKQGWDILHTLTSDPLRLIAQLKLG